MQWTPHKIANEFLLLAEEKGSALTNMQLQKLVFIAHGFTLAATEEPLVSQNVHAFEWGPVFPKLYKALRVYRAGKVTNRLPLNGEEAVMQLDNDQCEIVKAVWNSYGNYTGARLSAITHVPGSPWAQIYSKEPYAIIPNELIAQYYADLLHATEADTDAIEAESP